MLFPAWCRIQLVICTPFIIIYYYYYYDCHYASLFPPRILYRHRHVRFPALCRRLQLVIRSPIIMYYSYRYYSYSVFPPRRVLHPGRHVRRDRDRPVLFPALRRRLQLVIFIDGSYTKGTRAHTRREPIREWLWEPKRSSFESI